jgi:LAO/AO transport system kinase
MDDIGRLIRSSMKGEKLATARLISMVERGDRASADIMEAVTPHTGNAFRIGVTGPPGAGKSTIVNRLVGLFCQNRYSVGVIAVDPSSPFSGGALLGDRIRMTFDGTRHDVFFRSMSSGRVTGGLARTTGETARILDASGRQIIMIETVGVGQSELDISQMTDTVVVVLVPESGDTVQIMKAGLMEIGDIFAVNKSDRDGAEQLSESIRDMLRQSGEKHIWIPPVFQTTASLNLGMEELYRGLWAHHRYLNQNSRLSLRRKNQLKNELRRCLKEVFPEVLWTRFAEENDLNLMLHDLIEKKSDIRSFAETAVKQWLKKGAAGDHD